MTSRGYEVFPDTKIDSHTKKAYWCRNYIRLSWPFTRFVLNNASYVLLHWCAFLKHMADMAKSQQHDETQQPRWLRYGFLPPKIKDPIHWKDTIHSSKNVPKSLPNGCTQRNRQKGQTKFGIKKQKVFKWCDPQSLWQNRDDFAENAPFLATFWKTAISGNFAHGNWWLLLGSTAAKHPSRRHPRWWMWSLVSFDVGKEKQGLTASRPKTRTDIMLPDFRYAGIMITIESIQWVFKDNPQSMNSNHSKNKSRVWHLTNQPHFNHCQQSLNSLGVLS